MKLKKLIWTKHFGHVFTYFQKKYPRSMRLNFFDHRTVVWTWTHQLSIFERTNFPLEQKVWTWAFWTNESLDIRRFERTIVWTWTHKLSILERTNFPLEQKVWTWAFLNERKSGHKPFWTHDSLDMNAQIINFGAREFSFGTHKKSGHGHFWTH